MEVAYGGISQVTIEGRDLGLDVDQIVSVKLAETSCDLKTELYEPSSR